MQLELVKTKENEKYIIDWLKYLKSEKAVSFNTIKTYRNHLNNLIKYMPLKPLEKITYEDLNQFKSYLFDQKKRQESTVNHCFITIKSFFDYLIDYKDEINIRKNPAKFIKKLREPKKMPIVISERQAENLLDNILLFGRYALRDHAIFSTFLFTGMRVSELINLKIYDLDFSNRLIHIRNAKGKKDRIIPMESSFARILERYINTDKHYSINNNQKTLLYKSGRKYFLKDINEKSVFLTKSGEHFSEKGIEYLFKVYTKSAGIYREGLSIHALRRTCLTMLYKKKKDLFALMQISGHSSVKTLERYLSIDNQQIIDLMDHHPLKDRGIDIELINKMRDKMLKK
jgi:site-specific recombinase XerD